MSDSALWAPAGTLNFDSAAKLFDQARALKPARVDLSGVTEADSTAVALLVELARVQAARGRKLAVAGMPTGVRALCDLYGVDALFDLDALTQ